LHVQETGCASHVHGCTHKHPHTHIYMQRHGANTVGKQSTTPDALVCVVLHAGSSKYFYVKQLGK
jgi:hypothetical protein